jgi:BirA family biotin operon repressor/biotin-[acetyl-CoA-carboxylase] ligase
MYIIKLDAIDSTNAYLKSMTSVALPKDFTVVASEVQTKGRGQMGTFWQSEKGKNLTVSVFKRVNTLNIDEQFYVSMAVSLAICQGLKKFRLPKLKIKWPNDILSEDKKICGILIENVIKNNSYVGSVIGFGLNVNQKYFYNLPNASSLYLLTGVLQDKDEVLSEVLNKLKLYLGLLDTGELAAIKEEFQSQLFRIHKPSTFKPTTGETFSGIIKGIDNDGKLRILIEDDIIKSFNFKEVNLLY